MPGHILIFDYGTTALKTVLFDRNFRCVGRRETPFVYRQPGGGRMEYDPRAYIAGALDAAAGLIAETGSRGSVELISITGQAETLIPVDAQNKPLGEAIVWLDTRAQAEAAALRAEIGGKTLYERTGNPDFDPVMPAAKLKWMKTHEPARFAAASRFLLLRDWVYYNLTGEIWGEYGILSCGGYFDIQKKAYDPALLAAAGVTADRLAPPAPPSALLGVLQAEPAAVLGLPGGIPVANGMLDQCAAALGAGNYVPGVYTETTGTVLALAATLPDFDPGAFPAPVPVLCHGLPERYLALPYCPTAGILLRWFRDNFLPGQSFADIDRAIAARENPNEHLICLPHFAGCLSPRHVPQALGAFAGLTLDTVPADMARAILEGVCFLLRENVEHLRGAGLPNRRLRSLGGGARSPLWLQMKADTLNMPVEAMAQEEATALGCAIGAALSAGMLGSLDEAAAAMEIAGVYVPRPDRAAKLAEKYARYLDLNRRMGYAT